MLAWEVLLMDQRRHPAGAGIQKTHGAAQCASVSFMRLKMFPKGHERPGQDCSQLELVTQVPGATGFKPEIIRHEEVANSNFY